MTIPAAEDDARSLPAARQGGERSNARGQATRLLLLITAEELFATHGISAVPLRDIAKAAGQRNHAVVQYHFGEREEVVKALTDYRGAASEKMRADMVAELMLGATSPTVEDVVEAFVRPLALHFRPDNHYLQFLSMLITQEGGYQGLVGVHTGGQVMTLRALLFRLLPETPEAVLIERWWVTLTSAVHTLARYQTAQRRRERLPQSIDHLVDDLIRFLAAGLGTPHR
ncbi:TetR/AcrR family transcriptional regulator [Microbacterium sp. Leaf159]|uniref:TetR/AcrR family transcriptional regulator n=1 Tax=Microbacterium sp. Leaf159 TaxID=1736279 RepID=UPI000700740B|nr:TetR/AcrR family transcriptional regulator [Microbacterium sp. Leaf159]KQR37449.1 hypothetical protein ASF80_16980 [Microbacterium sp. Leaf159]